MPVATCAASVVKQMGVGGLWGWVVAEVQPRAHGGVGGPLGGETGSSAIVKCVRLV